MSVPAHRIGAIFYMIWGLLHVPIGYSVYMSGTDIAPGPIQGRMFQISFYLGAAGIASFVIAKWNWKNHPAAYWANLWLTSLVDIGFLVFLLFPGYLSLVRGLPAPIIWVIAVTFSTIGYLRARHERRTQATPLK